MVKNITLTFSVIIINIKVNVNIVPISIKGISFSDPLTIELLGTAKNVLK